MEFINILSVGTAMGVDRLPSKDVLLTRLGIGFLGKPPLVEGRRKNQRRLRRNRPKTRSSSQGRGSVKERVFSSVRFLRNTKQDKE